MSRGSSARHGSLPWYRAWAAAAVVGLGAALVVPAAGTAQGAPVDDCATPDRTVTAAATGNSPISVAPGEVVALTGGTFPGGID